VIITKKTSELELGDLARPDWLLVWKEGDDFREVVYNEQDDPDYIVRWHTSVMDFQGVCTVFESMGFEKWLVNVDQNS
jgi:hypothetical protein